MVKLTLIHRVRDGLPLAEGLDTDKDHEMYSYKSQAKVGRSSKIGRRDSKQPANSFFHTTTRLLPPPPSRQTQKLTFHHSCSSLFQTLFKKIAASPTKPPPRMSIESSSFMFHYIIEGDVVYLVLVDKAYPKKLAFQYLEELSKEFNSLYGQQIDQVTRPYAFIKFDTFIQKTKKLYMDTRTQRNIERLNADIAEVHSIMTRNIQDVLGQGERLDRT
jgi:vesicle transport protein SEC22